MLSPISLFLNLLWSTSTSDNPQVVSPFQAILDYELERGIPPGWVNYSISKTNPTGSWHQLERGEIPLDAAFFQAFNSDLRNPHLWSQFYAQVQARSQVKDSQPPSEIPPVPELDAEKLFWEMMRASRYPDPWMVPALRALKASNKYIIAALSNTVIFPPDHEFSKPNVREFGEDVRAMFDVFISSAHVGLRKPDPRMYALALSELDKFAKANASTQRGKDLGWGNGVKAGDIVFLDDIGENLKWARKAGFGTIKVDLGRAYEAVDKLEELTGLQLAGSHPRVAVKPKMGKAKL